MTLLNLPFERILQVLPSSLVVVLDAVIVDDLSTDDDVDNLDARKLKRRLDVDADIVLGASLKLISDCELTSSSSSSSSSVRSVELSFDDTDESVDDGDL